MLSYVGSKENLRVIPPVPQQQIVSLATTARLLLHWSDRQVKIWRVEEIGEAEFDGEERIEKRYLLEMDLNVNPFCCSADN